MQAGATIRMLRLVTMMMSAVLALFTLWAMILLAIALIAPAYWPGDYTLTTALRGFDLPTIYLEYRLIFVARMLATLALAALFVLPILGIARSLDKAGPFTLRNVNRLRLLALACAVYGFGPLLVPAIPVSARIPLGLLHAYVNWPAAALAVAALALAEIFREGLRLREDVDATI